MMLAVSCQRFLVARPDLLNAAYVPSFKEMSPCITYAVLIKVKIRDVKGLFEA